MLTMNLTAQNPCIINVEAKPEDAEGDSPYFKATAAFNQKLMVSLEKRFEKLKTITARVDFQKYNG